MREIPAIGSVVRLKPARADAYGFAVAARYTVADVYCRDGYKVPWVVLAELEQPANVVRLSELRV